MFAAEVVLWNFVADPGLLLTDFEDPEWAVWLGWQQQSTALKNISIGVYIRPTAKIGSSAPPMTHFKN